MSVNFDELFDAAMAAPNAEHLQALYNALSKCENPAEQAELLRMMLSEWMESEEEDVSEIEAHFILQVLQLKIGDNAVFRKALSKAVKVLLPPYMNKPGLVRALGITDSNVSIHEAVRRFHNLLTVNNNTLVFLSSMKKWGVINNVDALAGSVAFAPLGSSSANAMPLVNILSDGTMFQLSVDSQRLAAMNARPMNSGHEYRNVAKTRALNHISDEEIKEIAFGSLVPAIVSESDFESWWNGEGGNTVASAASNLPASCKARSIQELELRLKVEDPKAGVSPEQVTAYRNFFANLKPAHIDRDGKTFAQVIALLSERLSDEEMAEVTAPLAGKCSFLPANPESELLDKFVIFGELNVKTLNRLFAALRLVKSDDYMAKLAVRLPLKALAALADMLPDEAILPALQNAVPTSDIYMYIWRNRAKRTKPLLDMINISSVVKVLNQTRMPKAWTAAVRDLKNTLMDKPEFHKQLLDSAQKDVKLITGALQAAHVLGSGERQSLLVKFSRLSRDLQSHLESGVGRQLVEDAGGVEQQAAPAEPLFSSVASLKRLKQELDDIINIHQPENREALKTARAHGDFRENAEFDAAKERRNFLTRRRNELERILTQAQAVTFGGVKPGKHAELGCTVTLQYPNGATEAYHLLGAWDGNPDKGYLSYKTRLGEAIYQHEIGTTVDLPGGKRATIAKIEALTPEIIAEMDEPEER